MNLLISGQYGMELNQSPTPNPFLIALPIEHLNLNTVNQATLNTNLFRPKGLFEMGVLEESGNRQNIGAGVHHDEEENTRQVQA